ncbi:acyltransferase [Phycicoccus sp. CSK15P-2]|uniref:acyltransferase family protein n=1 Tax=Phycicoccus sp. CSK15P-2 TaxID=2807627 RepID=UPI00194FC687|nr:acyltransferase [Phycicoccus sp. CSK15P-2]MBM6404403.1 acyltransferase [Phycicoccus sp. CSK15P-2]
MDPLRAVAALSVVMFHVYQYEFVDIHQSAARVAPLRLLTVVSSAAVDLFFVISGFLLYLGVARSALSGGPGRSARMTLLRRVVRLYPLYALIILAVWGVTNTRLPGVWQDLVLHLTMTQIYSQEYIFWTNGPAWSLAVEFHFYVLVALSMPVVAATCRRRDTTGGRTWVLLALPAALLVVGLAWLTYAIVVAQTPVTHWPTWFGFLAKAPMFGLGMGLAVIVVRGARIHRRSVRVGSLGLAAAGSVVALAYGTSGPADQPSHEWWHLVYAATSLFVLAPVVLSSAGPPRLLTWRPMVFLGTISYGIYLLHEPAMRLLGHVGLLPTSGANTLTVVAGWLLVSAVAVAGAWASAALVERPALKLLALFEPDGRRREYYPHLVESRRPEARRHPAEVGAG